MNNAHRLGQFALLTFAGIFNTIYASSPARAETNDFLSVLVLQYAEVLEAEGFETMEQVRVLIIWCVNDPWAYPHSSLSLTFNSMI